MKLRIEKPIYGGAGLARAEGKAVFVPFTLPGELVEARAVEDKRSYTAAELEAVLEPSPARVEPPCPYFGACGGCHYQHASYAAQVEMKKTVLRETLERAKLGGIPEIEAVAGQPLGYRNRVRLHIEGNPFHLCYKLRNSRVSLPVERCPIAAPLLQRAMAALNAEGEALRLAEWAREVEFFTNEDESAMLAAFWTEREPREAERALQQAWPRLRELLPELAGAGVLSLEHGRRASRLIAQHGEEALPYRCGEHTYRVGLGSFFQANRFLVERLVELAVGEERGDRAWDLYAGVGLFSLPLASRFREVTAVETAASSVRELRENLRGTRHRVVAAETAAFLRQAADRREPAPELVVVDPPRDGLGAPVTSQLGKIRPQRITYVSCDPATLSRDLAALLESGYRLARMHLIDLFPQTFHLESVTHLTLG